MSADVAREHARDAIVVYLLRRTRGVGTEEQRVDRATSIAEAALALLDAATAPVAPEVKAPA